MACHFALPVVLLRGKASHKNSVFGLEILCFTTSYIITKCMPHYCFRLKLNVVLQSKVAASETKNMHTNNWDAFQV